VRPDESRADPAEQRASAQLQGGADRRGLRERRQEPGAPGDPRGAAAGRLAAAQSERTAQDEPRRLADADQQGHRRLQGRGDAGGHRVGDRGADRDRGAHRDGDAHADRDVHADGHGDADGDRGADRERDTDRGRRCSCSWGPRRPMTTDELFADRYRLERRLGVGGMATVQLAFDTRLERYVAVKLLAEHLAEDSNFVSRFRREALAVARLVHPNIVQVFDFGLDEATHRNFIVMEYVDGQSCAEILREQGTLPPNEAVDILTQAFRGLDYAHRNGVVHRDVKPGNLMRSEEGMVKLADFGIAKAAEDSDITKVGSVLGTAAYLAPEQARGEPAGPSSDLYALGVVAHQRLAGRLPYDAGSLTDLARLQESGPPPRLDELQPRRPPRRARAR